jgi:hypothetical protein
MQLGPAPQPAPVVTTNVTLTAPPPDPAAIAEVSVQSSQSIMAVVIAPPPVQWATEMLNLPDFWRTTPPGMTYEHPEIQSLVHQMEANAWVLVPLALLAVGIAVAVGHYRGMGGRPVFGVIATMGAMVWCRLAIEANNVICAAIGAPDLPSILKGKLEVALDPTDVGLVVLTVVWAIVSLMLMGALVARLFILDVLMVIAPIALACFIAPQTERWGNRWGTLFFGLCFSQILMVIGFKLVGVFVQGNGIGWTMFGIIALLTIRKLPGMLANTPGSDGGTSRIQRVVERTAVRRLAHR